MMRTSYHLHVLATFLSRVGPLRAEVSPRATGRRSCLARVFLSRVGGFRLRPASRRRDPVRAAHGYCGIPFTVLLETLDGVPHGFLSEFFCKQRRGSRAPSKSPAKSGADELTAGLDVYALFCFCRQCWASKCRGL
jgi:hypothetical protein